MAAVSIRGLDDEVKARLRIRAAEHGRSMEAEIRAILTEAVTVPEVELAVSLSSRLAALGGIDLVLPSRGEEPRVADLSW